MAQKMPQTYRSYDFTVGDLITLIKGSLLPCPPISSLNSNITPLPYLRPPFFFLSSHILIPPEHASLSFPSHPITNIRVVTWHIDNGRVQAAVIANRVGTVSSGGGGDSKSTKVQNKMLYRTEAQGKTEDALRQLLKGLEGMTMQRFKQVPAGMVV